MNRIVGAIYINKDEMYTNNTNITYQYSDDLQLTVEFQDDFFDNVSLIWMYSQDFKKEKTGILEYDSKRKLITLPKIMSDGNFFIQLRSLGENGEIYPTNIISFYIGKSLNNVPHDMPNDDWEKGVLSLIEQVFQSNYKDLIDNLIADAREQQKTSSELQKALDNAIVQFNNAVDDLNLKIENGDFIPDLQIGTVETGDTSEVTITGNKASPLLNFILKKGDKGISLRIKGDWQSDVEYVNDSHYIDIVFYNGSSYTCIQSHTSTDDITPSSIDHWQFLAQKGDTGAIGPQGPKGPRGDSILATHIVTELPEAGGTSDIYFVVDGDSYISYMYVEDKWIVIGSGNVDLSNYYTKDETKEIANLRIKGYSAKTEETSLLQTLTIAYKNEVKNNNDGDAIEKVFLLGLDNASDTYDLMGLEKTRYVVTFFQFPRKASSVYFTFSKTNQTNKDEKYYIDLKTDANDNVVILSDNSVRKVKLIDEFGEAINQFKTDYIIDSEGNTMIGKGQNETNVGVDSRTTTLRGSAVNVKRVSGSQATWEDVVSSRSITSIKRLTLAQYNALSTKDSKTLYLVVG